MKAKNLDDESHIAVIYQILKDNLRKAKKQLLKIKQNREIEAQKARDFKQKLKEAVAKGEKDALSLHDKVKDVIDDEGTNVFKFIGSQRSLPPALKLIIQNLLSSDNKSHYRYCPCCRGYENGVNPNE